MPQTREYFAAYREKNRTLIREKSRNKARKSRLQVINALGGKCLFCGFNDIRALQVDHINGGGRREKDELYGNSALFNDAVLASISRKEIKYQLLCANCNWIKRITNNEVWTLDHNQTSH